MIVDYRPYMSWYGVQPEPAIEPTLITDQEPLPVRKPHSSHKNNRPPSDRVATIPTTCQNLDCKKKFLSKNKGAKWCSPRCQRKHTSTPTEEGLRYHQRYLDHGPIDLAKWF